jgi:prophage regulatory protein
VQILDQEPIRFIRQKEAGKRDGLSNTQRWRLEKAGQYPARIKLTERSVGWIESEVDAWVYARVKAAGRIPTPPLPKSRRAAGAEA